MKISFIIPNYKGESLLSKNLPKVFEASADFVKKDSRYVEIIVVDDCSGDSSEKVVSQIASSNKNSKIDLIYIQHKKNKGFSSTVNDGVRIAKGELVVLLNTDAYPKLPDGFIEKFINFFNDPELFAVGFMDESIEEDNSVVLRGRGEGRWSKGFLIHNRGEVNSNETLWVNGGSSVYRKSIWDILGGMNEIYNPFYWEDIDISYRALKSGYKIRFEPSCIIVHEHEQGAIKKTRSRFDIQKIAYRNQFFFVWTNATSISLILTHVLWIPYYLFRTIVNRDFAFIYGLFLALLKMNQVIRFRSKSKKFFKLSDYQVTKQER